MSTPPGVIPLTQAIAQPSLVRFDKYVLVRKLAEGGMAEIYLAKQVGAEGFERDVVLKLMLGHLSSAPEFVEMFLDEARLAAKLHHPNIVQISDLGLHQGRFFICMEYLPGEDLQAVVEMAQQRGQAIPFPVASRIILSACEGLEFAHAYQENGAPLGVVHRDVSPSNIIVTYQGLVKVLDFGIAKAGSKLNQTQPGLLKGKWGYMSPEQARGDPLDARSDLFSLGITFHELLTGQRVFRKDNEIGVLFALMQQPIPPPSAVRKDIPPALDRIVMKALEKKLPDRYPDAGAFRADLEQYLATTGSPGMSQLGQFMVSLFGKEQMRARTQIPSIKDLGPISSDLGELGLPMDRVGIDPTFVRKATDMVAVPDQRSLRVADTSGALAPPPPPSAARSTLRAALAGALALALLTCAGTGGYYFLVLRPRQLAQYAQPQVPPPPPMAVVMPPVPPMPPQMGAIPPVPPVPVPVGVIPVPPVPPPELAPPGPEDSPATVLPRRPILLTTREVTGPLARARPQVKACLVRNQPELSAGKLEVELAIANSGAVKSARVLTAGLEDGPLAGCVSRALRGLRFPKNTNNPPLTIIVPYNYAAAGQ